MATRPSSLPTWATTGTRVSPSGAKRNAGFALREAVPSTLANALFGEAGDWVEYLDEVATDHEGRVEDLEDTAVLLLPDASAASSVDVGRVVHVDQSARGPLQRIDGVNIGATIVDVCSDGEYVWAATSTAVFRLSAVDLTGGGAAFWTAPAGTVASVTCSGDILYAASSSTVYAISRTAGTTLKSQAVGSTITRLRTNGAALFLSRGNLVERWDIVAAPNYIATSANWQYDHAATVNDIAVFASDALGVSATDYATGVAVAAAPDGGGANVGAVVLTDDGNNYAVAGVFLSGATGYAVGSNGRCVAWGRRDGSSDGYVTVTSVRGIRSVTPTLSAIFSTPILTDQTGDDDIKRIVVTDRYIAAIDDSANGSCIYLCNLANGAVMAAAVDNGVTGGRADNANVICADARGLIIGRVDSADTTEVDRLSDGVGLRMCVRRAANDPGRSPYHQLLCPVSW